MHIFSDRIVDFVTDHNGKQLPEISREPCEGTLINCQLSDGSSEFELHDHKCLKT